MSKFKIGDKVRICNVTDHRREYNGKEFVISSINPNDFMRPLKTHYSVGAFYIFFENELELITNINNKIVITTDGTETLARLYDGNKVIKSAVAKCSPDDTFNFGTGARIAFDRLMEDKKAHEYKAGDKVKVIANTCGHYCKIGETVTLTKIYYVGIGGTEWHIKEHGGYICDCDFIPYTAEEEKPKIKVGDRVKVVDSGQQYTRYIEWFEKNAPELLAYFNFGSDLPEDGIFTVKKIARHSDDCNKSVCAIENTLTGAVYLIGEEGIARA